MIPLSIDVSSDACDSTLASASVVSLNKIKQHTECYIATSVNFKKGVMTIDIRLVRLYFDASGARGQPVSYTHLTLPTNREV